jgi:catechol 2,3-dioxygenase-like lactoylglutathione lyase family enzyme
LRDNNHDVQVVTNRYPRSLPAADALDGVSVRRLLFLTPARKTLVRRPDLFLSSLLFYPLGLHHLALLVDSRETLDEIYAHLLEHAVHIEFPPELLRDGPAQHMICYEPSGIRLEFIWPGN